jgi:hypothetical protein
MKCQRFLGLDLDNLTGNCLQTSKNEVVAAFKGKNKVTHSMPYPENEHQ